MFMYDAMSIIGTIDTSSLKVPITLVHDRYWAKDYRARVSKIWTQGPSLWLVTCPLQPTVFIIH